MIHTICSFRLRIWIALVFVTCFAAGCAAQATKPVLVALNKAEGSLAIVDPTTMKLIAKVPTGDNPHEVILSSDGKTAFVANYGAQTPGNSISVIDIASAKELRRVDLSPLLRPHGLQFLGGKLYFTCETNRLIARYDPAANKIDWLMGSGQNATHMLAASSDQKRFYTTNIGSDSVTAFEFQNVPPAPSKVTHIPVGKQPEAIDLSPDGKEVWAGLNVDGGIDIIDTVTNKVIERIKLGERPYRVRFTPDGKRVVATIPTTKEIVLIDAATRKEIKRSKIEGVPLGIVFSTDGKTAFITAVQPNAALRVDVEKLEITAKLDIGNGPDGIALFGM